MLEYNCQILIFRILEMGITEKRKQRIQDSRFLFFRSCDYVLEGKNTYENCGM